MRSVVSVLTCRVALHLNGVAGVTSRSRTWVASAGSPGRHTFATPSIPHPPHNFPHHLTDSPSIHHLTSSQGVRALFHRRAESARKQHSRSCCEGPAYQWMLPAHGPDSRRGEQNQRHRGL